MGRQIINTGGPARTRYQAIRAAFLTLIVFICIVIIVFFVRGRRTHQHVPATYHHAGARAAGAANP